MTVQKISLNNSLVEGFEQLWALQPDGFASYMQASDKEDTKAECRSPSFLAQPEDRPPYELVDGVAVIPVEGMILRRSFFSFCTGLKDLRASLDAALNDATVRGVLFSVHSPGGQATGVKELADAVFAARKVKPCAAWVDGLAASAAYWLASSTGTVYAGPSATVGSIGVILRHMNKAGFNAQLGLAYTYVTAGSYKAVGHPDAPLSERDQAVLQSRVNAVYEMFCGDVAQRMGLAMENRTAWADGRDFLAAEAESLGLVSAIVPSRDEAIHKLLKETRMDKAELAKCHPDLLAVIEQEAAEAALKRQAEEQKEKEDQAVATVISLMETVCGKDKADKVRALINAGVTPEQLKAAAGVFGIVPGQDETAATSGANTRAEMLSAIKEATPRAVSSESERKDPDDVQAMIQRIGTM